ncbi:hypothetical protein [Halobacteriovorax sp. RT-2-4]|uniref:hypothetical protein n=1 Tax=unclassified Halobacteriovorax TaxID=2639665 RepID=UPI00399BEEDE
MKFTLALIILITTNTVTFAKDSDPEIPFVLTNTTVKDSKGKQVAKTMNGWAGGPLLWQSPGNAQYTMEQSQDTKMVKSSTITKIVKNTNTISVPGAFPLRSVNEKWPGTKIKIFRV